MKKAVLVVFVLLVAWLGWEWLTFPDVSRLKSERPTKTAFMEQRERELKRAGKETQIVYRWVSYSRISPYLRRAVLVSEDSSFYDHEGFDVDGMKDALRKNWEKKRIAGGGSTVTQQLAKNLYLSPSKNPLRKFKELLIARALERELSKKRILELYLNVVELGERVYGAEAASQHYFGKSAASLTPREAALLAGALPNPRLLNPAKPTRRLRARQRIILSRLRRWGHLAEQEVLTERKTEVKKEEAVETTTGDATDTTVPEVTEPDETELPADRTTATETETSTESEPAVETPPEPPTETTTEPPQ